jgi:hypothetical protein
VSDRIKRAIADGVLYYKLAAAEFLFLCGVAFCTTFAAVFEGMTDAKWQELGHLGRMAKLALIAGAVFATGKAYLSDRVSRLGQEQDERDGADVRTH